MANYKNKFGRLPGDLSQNEMVERMIRVNHAGEYGAKRIYEGQLSVLGDTKEGEIIREMEMAERRHLEKFSELIVKRRVRPTVLSPLWHVAGYALGVVTAKLGKEAAMACTVAVEEVIEEHYADQYDQLNTIPEKQSETELKSIIEDFREEEIEHRNIALDNDALDAPGYPVLTKAIKSGSKLAIWLSERL